MEAVAYSTFRNGMKDYMRKTRDDAEALLVVSRDSSENIVVMSARDYDGLMETFRIYQNRPLHEKILRGIRQASEGAALPRDLIEDDD